MIGFIVAGLVIGALARLVKPGRQRLGLLATLLLGLVGSVIGAVLVLLAYNAVTRKRGLARS